MIRRALSQLRRTIPPPHQRHHLLLNHHAAPLPPFISGGSKPSFLPFFSRSFSDDASSSDPPPGSDSSSFVPPFEDVKDEDFTRQIENYFEDKEDLQDVFDSMLKRTLTGKHEETDEKIINQLQSMPSEDMDLEEEDVEELFETNKELGNLYNARQYVEKKMTSSPFFNVDDKMWDQMIQQGTEKGYLQSTKECEGILEDMLNYDKLLPDEIKKKVQAKYNELEGMCDSGELEAEKAYELFKEFEDKMVAECIKIMDSKKAPEGLPVGGDEGKKDKLAKQKKKKVELDDPPGEGPILRWESRVVFAPGAESYHPKNRKVKLSVTVKELGLSKYASKRLREVVGKRYNSGRDELTITSERYEYREENRKDCLRTLYGLIQDAVKADKLVEEARTSYLKESLKKNMLFMERLKSKATELKQAQAA